MSEKTGVAFHFDDPAWDAWWNEILASLPEKCRKNLSIHAWRKTGKLVEKLMLRQSRGEGHACFYGDPTCPCQDGLMCHYEGENPMNVPAVYVRSRMGQLIQALEFYSTAWDAHPGDSGPGGNWPQDPVCNPDQDLLEDGGDIARAALKAGGRRPQ
ncbi:MAG: hypothetical protein ACR2RF_24890 [Geminicoccaceae bacterium]